MKKILILNGPNLNLLGLREPEIYGDQTLLDVEELCREKAVDLGFKIEFRQSNHEGELVDWIQDARGIFSGVIINAGAYTHTSLAIHDALRILDVPVIEVHISDPKKREEFRHFSYIEPIAHRHFVGMGTNGYLMALDSLRELL
ncbi:type II 3-dehydroquinate dehydratase [Alphaproteobacteria bacterium]|nr:type II 3-dehydroquinate dehydratase [Alphaproteobacteria bacterium]